MQDTQPEKEDRSQKELQNEKGIEKKHDGGLVEVEILFQGDEVCHIHEQRGDKGWGIRKGNELFGGSHIGRTKTDNNMKGKKIEKGGKGISVRREKGKSGEGKPTQTKRN